MKQTLILITLIVFAVIQFSCATQPVRHKAEPVIAPAPTQEPAAAPALKSPPPPLPPMPPPPAIKAAPQTSPQTPSKVEPPAQPEPEKVDTQITPEGIMRQMEATLKLDPRLWDAVWTNTYQDKLIQWTDLVEEVTTTPITFNNSETAVVILTLAGGYTLCIFQEQMPSLYAKASAEITKGSKLAFTGKIKGKIELKVEETTITSAKVPATEIGNLWIRVIELNVSP